MYVYNTVETELIDWKPHSEPLVSGRLTGHIPFTDVATPQEFEHHLTSIESRRRLRTELRDEIARTNSHVPHLSVIDDDVMREVEAELIQEMGSDPIELFRMDVAAHATALLGPRIMSLCSDFGVVAEVERPSDAIRVIVCRSFATDADRELFESGASAPFKWLIKLCIDIAVHGLKSDCYDALITLSEDVFKCGEVIDFRAVYRPSPLDATTWEDLTGRSLKSARARRRNPCAAI